MEMIGPAQRMVAGLFYNIWFAVGYMVLAALAPLIKDYSWTCFTISFYPIVFLSYYW